jgi:hypothetical protein
MAMHWERRAAGAGSWPHNLELREGSDPSHVSVGGGTICPNYSSHSSLRNLCQLPLICLGPTQDWKKRAPTGCLFSYVFPRKLMRKDSFLQIS